MPRTARPSGACQNCKKHHVKCDEARPACRRCVRSKRVCPGYPEGLDLVLRDQNQAARAVVDRRRNALSKRTTPSVDGSQTSQSQSPPSLTIPCGLIESEDTNARCFFIANFVLFTRDSQADCGFLELLPTLFESLRVDCAVSLALTAVSRCMFGALIRKNRDTETADVRAAFIHAVAATRTAIENPTEALSDGTLMAVCLLGFYEAARDAFRSKLSSARHFQGAAALIENRKISNMNSELAKKIVLAVRNGIVTRAISYCNSIDTTSEVWQDYEQLPQNPATLLDDMSVEVANILGTASRTPQRIVDVEEVETGSPSPTSGPLVRAIAAEARLASWPRAVPRNWIPIRVHRRHIQQEVIDAGLYSDYCEIFPDVVICSTWNSWRRIRLKNLSLIAQLDPEGSGIQAVVTMQKLADDICATIPFNLGSRTEITPFYDGAAIYPSLKGKSLPTDHARAAVAVGGWSLWSPLKEIINVHMYLRPGQREWVRDQLFRLAKIYDVVPHGASLKKMIYNTLHAPDMPFPSGAKIIFLLPNIDNEVMKRARNGKATFTAASFTIHLARSSIAQTHETHLGNVSFPPPHAMIRPASTTGPQREARTDMEVGMNADVDTEPGDELKSRLSALSARIEASTVLVRELRVSKQALSEERMQSRKEGKEPPSSLPRQDSLTHYIRPCILISLVAVMAFMLLRLCTTAYSLSADRCIAPAPKVVLAPATRKFNLDAVPSRILSRRRISTEAKSQETSITVPSETHISQADNSPCATTPPTCTCSRQTRSPKSQQSTTYPATTYPATTYLNSLPPSSHEKTTIVHPSLCIEELIPVRQAGRLQIRPEVRCTLPTTIVVG